MLCTIYTWRKNDVCQQLKKKIRFQFKVELTKLLHYQTETHCSILNCSLFYISYLTVKPLV
jgi:hypothetical protein